MPAGRVRAGNVAVQLGQRIQHDVPGGLHGHAHRRGRRQSPRFAQFGGIEAVERVVHVGCGQFQRFVAGVGPGEGDQLGVLLVGLWAVGGRQFVQERLRLGHHPAPAVQLDEVRVSKHFGQLLAQRQDLGHYRTVRLGGTSDGQPVHRLSQRAVLRLPQHHGRVLLGVGHVVPGQSTLGGGVARGRDQRVGQAGGVVGADTRGGVRSAQVRREVGGELSQTGVDRGQAVTLGLVQMRTDVLEPAQQVDRSRSSTGPDGHCPDRPSGRGADRSPTGTGGPLVGCSGHVMPGAADDPIMSSATATTKS